MAGNEQQQGKLLDRFVVSHRRRKCDRRGVKTEREYSVKTTRSETLGAETHDIFRDD